MAPGMKAEFSITGYYREGKAWCHCLLFLFKTCHQSEMYGFLTQGVISPLIPLKWIAISALPIIKCLEEATLIKVIDIGCKMN